mgnify:FL=1
MALTKITSRILDSSGVTILGTIATGVWAATDIAVLHGGTGASTAGAARTNLGLVIGTHVLAQRTFNDTNWDNAYADRLKWDGGATGLTASTGRTSLGLGTVATTAASDYATAAQGTKADTAHGWGDHTGGGYVKTTTDQTIAGVKTFSNDVALSKLTTTAGLEYQVRNANGSSGDHVFKSYNTAILTLNGATNVATFGNIVTSSGLTVNTGNGAGKKIYLNGNTSRRNWLISSQENVDDAFEITRSTANGGSTYNSPSFLIQGSTGNVGIGTSTIESYWSGYTALKVGYNNSIFGNTADSVGSAFFISQNLYNDGGNYRYVGSGSDEGGLIDLRGGAFVFSNAPLGTAGNVASIVPRLTISSGGEVGIGTTGVYTTNAILNLQGSGIALKNDKNGSNNNWSYIQNTGTGSNSDINFYTGNNASALNLSHSGAATFANNISATGMVTIIVSDISTGENKGLKLQNTGGGGKTWNITPGLTGVNNSNFTIRNATDNINALTISSSGAATFQSDANKVTINSTNSTQATIEIGRSVDTKAKITAGDVSSNDFNIYTLGVKKLAIGTNWANTLDAYEEGTYVPSLVGTTTINFTQRNSSYTRIGNVCTVVGVMAMDTITGSNQVTIDLPFTCITENNAGYAPVLFIPVVGFNPSGGAENIIGTVFEGTNTFKIWTVASTTGNNLTNVAYNDLTSSSTFLRYTVTYRTI